jgi:hypothetical protein
MWILIATQLMTSSAPPLSPAEAVKVLRGSHSIIDRTDVVGWDPAPPEVYVFYPYEVREDLAYRNDRLWWGHSWHGQEQWRRFGRLDQRDAIRRNYLVGSVVPRLRYERMGQQRLRRENGRIR